MDVIHTLTPQISLRKRLHRRLTRWCKSLLLLSNVTTHNVHDSTHKMTQYSRPTEGPRTRSRGNRAVTRAAHLCESQSIRTGTALPVDFLMHPFHTCRVCIGFSGPAGTCGMQIPSVRFSALDGAHAGLPERPSWHSQLVDQRCGRVPVRGEGAQ